MNESNKQDKFLMLKEKADNGDAESQLKVGEMYEDGLGVEQSYINAFKYYMLASEQDINEAHNYIGLLYQDGLGVEKNFIEAAKYFKKAANNGYKYANNNLGFLYLNGLGVEKNFNEAFERLNNTSSQNKYLLNILTLIKHGSKVIEIDNISELIHERYNNLTDNDVIIFKYNNEINYHDYYTFGICKKILNTIKYITIGVDLNDTEIEKFLKVYMNLAKYLSYDSDAYNPKEYTQYVEENATTSRNLIGLLTKKCICGGYSDILVNVLSCVGIKSKKLQSYDHAFNKVKIDNKWYYCDLTLDCKNINNNGLKYCLLSKVDFEDEFSHIAFNDFTDEFNNSEESYPGIDEILKDQKINHR